MPNQQLQNEFHKLIIRNYKIRRVYFSFKDNIWGAQINLLKLRAYWYETGLVLMLYKFVDKKYTSFANKSAKDSGIKSMPNQQLQNEFHKLIIRKYKIEKGLFFI